VYTPLTRHLHATSTPLACSTHTNIRVLRPVVARLKPAQYVDGKGAALDPYNGLRSMFDMQDRRGNREPARRCCKPWCTCRLHASCTPLARLSYVIIILYTMLCYTRSHAMLFHILYCGLLGNLPTRSLDTPCKTCKTCGIAYCRAFGQAPYTQFKPCNFFFSESDNPYQCFFF
jgi:hypothetical protein